MGFLLVILAGALLLWACNNLVYGFEMSFVDSLFMATSSICVTGLATVNVSDMGFMSQLIIMVLVQIGGLGIITSMTFLAYMAGRHIGVKSRAYLMSGYGIDSLAGAVNFMRSIIRYTLFFEFIGFIILFIGFRTGGYALRDSLWYSVFHAVSGFCNAGFSTFAENLRGFSGSYIVPSAVMMLVVCGGLGFPVYIDIAHSRKFRRRLSHHSKLVIYTTLSLIIAGTAMFLLSDWDSALSPLSCHLRVWNALFLSVSTRTAGFETVPMASFSGLGLAITIIFMMIGASPASTGGGIKTTTFGVLFVSVKNELVGRADNTFWKRRISPNTVRRALSIAFLYLCTLMFGAWLLNLTEPLPFSYLMVEAASALGTVGLSAGITDKISEAGKIILVLMMFWGRVGIFTFFASIIKAEKGSEVHYAETDIYVG